MYQIEIDQNGRVFHVTSQPSPDAEIVVDEVPSNVLDCRYVNGEFVYDPLPEPEPGPYVPTPEEQREMDIDALTLDHEIRLSMLELGLTGGEV